MFLKSLIAALLIIPAFAWSQTEYVVRNGDTLLKIADKALGNSDRKDPRRYEFVKGLIKLNPSLKNPNALVPGQTILLPTDAVAAKETPAKEVAVKEAPVKEAPATEAAANEKVQSLKPVAAAAEAIAAKPAPQIAAPAPTPAPAAAEAKPASEEKPVAEAKHEEAHHNFIFVQPRYQTVKLVSEEEATATEATMKSTSSVGLDLQYGVILNSRWHLLFQGGVTSTQFGNITDGVSTVNHKSEVLKSFAAGVAYEATPSLHLDLLALYTEQSFLLPVTAGDYELKAVAFPGAELNASWDFYTGASNIFGVSAIGEYLAAVTKDSVEYKSILEPYGALYWKSNKGPDHVNYKVTLTYKHGHQETSLAKKVEQLSVLGVGFYF